MKDLARDLEMLLSLLGAGFVVAAIIAGIIRGRKR